MKKFTQLIFPILIAFIAFNLSSCGGGNQNGVSDEDSTVEKDTLEAVSRGDSEIVNIVLLVDTENIPHPDSIDDINDYCRFSDQSSKTTAEEYLRKVHRKDSVVWYGISSSDPENDMVLIRMITHIDGVNLLDKNVIDGKKGIVRGKIIEGGKDNAVEKYELRFIVIKKDSIRNEYPIDPKLRI